MTNLFKGNVVPSGYLNVSGSSVSFNELAGVETSLPIPVTPFATYNVQPDGGTATRFRIREFMSDGTERGNSSYSDGAWTEYAYIPGAGVASVQIYYKNTSDTATGLIFKKAGVKTIDTNGNVNSLVVSNLVPVHASKLSIDADPSAERLMLIDRNTGELLQHRLLDTQFLTLTLPLKYSQEQSISCLVFDNELVYSGGIMDGVQCESADLAQ
ncbi:hypothetical protein [Pseudoalteromonas luteoviolacea]|uniref:hypothetical protein n=1 Tax=Pseudoalteromonas luteoviolacea TaxID=43657 RepID=UPI001B36C22B|nr:hypothetical protein [Pseudoalteromonas luteoviolacea]MBQ4836035.1 hypothetical protein [Pseudoalteromonas luteoviolacea]